MNEVAFPLLLSSLMACIWAECTPEPLLDDVPDINFAASINSDEDHPPSLAKFGSGDAWCSVEINDLSISPYIQVNFDSPVEIFSVAVGGHTGAFCSLVPPFTCPEYIVNYQLKYRPIGGQLQFITSSGGIPKTFPREQNVDQQTVELNNSIVTDILRVQALPGSWNSNNDRICITFEAYGCPSNATIVTGMASSRISSLTSSLMVSESSLLYLSKSPVIVTSTSALLNSFTTSNFVIRSSTITSTEVVSFTGSTSQSTSKSVRVRTTSTSLLVTESTLSAASQLQSTADLPIYISSSVVGVVLLLLILTAIIFAVIILLRKSRSKDDAHRFDNHLYGQPLDNVTSSNYKVHIDDYSPDDFPQYGVTENLYERVETENKLGEYENTDTVKKADQYERMEDCNGEQYQYECMESGIHEKSEEAGELYTDPEQEMNVAKDNHQNTPEQPAAHIAENCVESVNLNSIQLTNNPVYRTASTSDNNDLTASSGNSITPNPLYGHGACKDTSEENVNSPRLINDDDMVSNPLYGGSN